ncbi:MAG: amidohydrolase [Bacteroidota bacterium]|jgi:dihydroorotase|nr:amidohydrolase [Bacteroidota bacterium]
MITLIKNANIVNEGKIIKGNVLITDKFITEISENEISTKADNIIDADGKYLFPGCIDDQVHFREPGLTHKGEIYTEAKAAVAGGITSFMEMPNTVPNTFTHELLEQKYKRASEVSLANYSFFMGASNDNIEEVLKTDPLNVCGIKVFMGSSTGNMLVDKKETLEALFSKCKMLIATHCEDEATIKHNMEVYKEKYGEDVPMECHPQIRSEEACYKSSSLAVELAKKYNTRLHILHISTAKELELFDNAKPLKEKRITAEACVHHLWFSDKDYKTKGSLIKWNPAVKTDHDRDAILQGILDNKIDVIATDHAPHTLEEKAQSYFKAPSGGPLVQHSLNAMLAFYDRGKISLEKIAEKMAHAVADCFQIEKRGYIRKEYYADLVLVDLNQSYVVEKSNILYKCGWSPFEGTRFNSVVSHTFVSGHLVYANGKFDENKKGERLKFER